MPARSSQALRLLVSVLLALASARAAAAPADPLYAALRAARPEGPSLAVSGLVLERDAFKFRFDSGTFQFLSEAAGRKVGAVFVGQGSVTLSPASEAERRQLVLQTGDSRLEMLTDRFEELVLLFTDGTAAEIAAIGKAGPASPRAQGAFEKFFKMQRKDAKTNFQLRLLRDLTRPENAANGLFLAGFDGKSLPPALVLVDPAGLEWLAGDLGDEDSALFAVTGEDRGFWYLSERRKAPGAAATSKSRAPARARRYTIDTAIAKNEQIRGTTTILFEPLEADLRVLPVHLLGKLRVKEVSVAPAEGEAWEPASFIQENEKEDDDLGIVFSRPLAAATPVRLRISYEGKDVLEDAGDGNFFVESRSS